jgi:hypothetical protein
MCIGIDTTAYDGWHGVSPAIEIVNADFTQRREPARRTHPQPRRNPHYGERRTTSDVPPLITGPPSRSGHHQPCSPAHPHALHGGSVPASRPKSWAATDAEVVSWTIQAHMAGRSPDYADLSPTLHIATAEDLAVFLAAAAAQVSQHHDVGVGQADHLVTGLSIWPYPDDPRFARLLVDIGGPEHGPQLASRPIPLHALAPSTPCDPELAIDLALRHTFTQARKLIRHYQRLRLDPDLASRITRWCDRYRDERADHEAGIEEGQEPPSLLDVEITGCELLLDVGLRLDAQAIAEPGRNTGRQRAA